MEAKQTQPPARYSAGKLIQEMERLGLGTKATRHDIIQTLADRKYVTGEPIEPTCKGITVISALATYAERITTPDMTSELDAEMDAIAEGRDTQERVVDHSRRLLDGVIEVLLEREDEVAESLKTATDEDAKVGVCPVCGHDLMIKFAPKTKSYFVGCSGYPECSRTYPLPKLSKFEAAEGLCEVCGAPRIKVIQFKKKPAIMCLSPDCPTKKGPEMTVGTCPKCGGELRMVYSQFGKRYVRCENWDPKEHPVAYPLPQSGDIVVTGEVCGACGAPKVTITTRKGPWTICIDPECPERKQSGTSSGSWRNGGARKRPVKRTGKAKS
jgi:DNA topoisomerase-1